MKLEDMYPVTAPHLAILRDINASRTARNDAMRWLWMNGFGDHLPDDVIEQARVYQRIALRCMNGEMPAGVIAYDEAASDPAAMLEALDSGHGADLDDIGARLILERLHAERDRDYRVRLIKAVVSCRGSVHVLGPDPATWHHCQCGRTPALSAAACETATRVYSAEQKPIGVELWPPLDRIDRDRTRFDGARYTIIEQKPLKTNHVAFVDNLRVGDEECRVRVESGPRCDGAPYCPLTCAICHPPKDPLDEGIDGVTMRDLLVRAEQEAREDGEDARCGLCYLTMHEHRLQRGRDCQAYRSALTPAQRAAVSAYHSAQLRAKVAASEEARKLTIMVDRDLDEVE